MAEYCVKRRKPLLFIGSSGTGKTVVIKDFLAINPLDDLIPGIMNFNSYIDAPDV